MIKKLLIPLFSVAVLYSACSKSGTAAPETDMMISKLATGPDRIVYKINDTVYAGGYYAKSYAQKDNLSMSLNGVQGELIRESYDQFSGCRALFRFPPVKTPGDLKIEFTVRSGKNVSSASSPLRVLRSFAISEVWQALQKNYLMQINLLALRYTSNEFHPGNFGYQEPGCPLGSYFIKPIPSTTNQNVVHPFIPGISGIYTADFRNGVLQNIKILHGGNRDGEHYNPKDTYDMLGQVYGKPVYEVDYGSGGKTTEYKTAEFTITVTERNELMSTITKNP